MDLFTACDLFITCVSPSYCNIPNWNFTFFYLRYSKYNFIEGKHPVRVYQVIGFLYTSQSVEKGAQSLMKIHI